MASRRAAAPATIEAEPQTALVKQTTQQVAVVGATPYNDLISQALTAGNIQALEKIIELKERYEAEEARKAFEVDFANFKAEPVVITKNKHVRIELANNQVKEYDHATLDNVTATLGPALSKHRFGFRWETKQGPDGITVTCFLTHAQGHYRTNFLNAPPDASGSKNTVQAIGSTISYLQRYTLLSITGCASEHQDDDGDGSDAKIDDVRDKVEHLHNAKDLVELKRLYNQYVGEAKEVSDLKAIERYVAAKDARRKELEG